MAFNHSSFFGISVMLTRQKPSREDKPCLEELLHLSKYLSSSVSLVVVPAVAREG